MDKYKIIATLGEGSFGSVFKAVNTDTNQIVAIKKLKSDQKWEDAINMIEIKSLKRLNNHPNVIKVLEMIRKDSKIYIVMEFCEKELLKEL